MTTGITASRAATSTNQEQALGGRALTEGQFEAKRSKDDAVVISNQSTSHPNDVNQTGWKLGRKQLWRACSRVGLPVELQHITPSMENSVGAVGGTLHGSHQDLKAN